MIRSAQEADLSRIAEILVYAKRTAYRSIFQDDYGSFADLQVLKVVREYQAQPHLLARTLVFEEGGIVKGLLSREFNPDSAEAELCELYVDPFFWKMGVGQALMNYFIQEAAAAGKEKVLLWVICANQSARAFYEKNGFLSSGEIRLVEGTPIAEMRYCRTLKE